LIITSEVGKDFWTWILVIPKSILFPPPLFSDIHNPIQSEVNNYGGSKGQKGRVYKKNPNT
jgi:hypothetical protein